MQRKNDLTICIAAMYLHRMGYPDGAKVIKAFGYSLKGLESRLNRELTDIELSENDLNKLYDTGNEEEVEFLDTVGKIEALRGFDILELNTMSAKRWIFKIKNINYGKHKEK